MANDKPALRNQPKSSSFYTQDGHQPRPAYKAPPSLPEKAQGGYQAPAGSGKPATPTTGTGVKK